MTLTSPSQILPGARIDHFQIERMLGKGGMGAVFLAEDVNLGRKAAIKVLSPALLAEEGYRERFYREARHAARLNHPNIVGIYHLGETGGFPYFAMEYVEGTACDQLLKEGGALAPKRAVELVLQLLSGLAHALSQGIIHRDLKPANLVLGNDGVLRVLDFGLAKAEDSKALTRSGAVMGTPDFMAPEQGLGKKVTMTADVYAVGVILFQFLSGRLPFHGDSALEVMMAHVQQAPPPLGKLLPHLPAPLVRVVERCMEKDAGNRYQDYGKLQEELSVLLPQLEGIAAPAKAVDLKKFSSAETLPSGDSVGGPAPISGKGVTMAANSIHAPAEGTSISAPPGATPPVPAPANLELPAGYEITLRNFHAVYHAPDLAWTEYLWSVAGHLLSFWIHPIRGRNDLVLAVRDPATCTRALYWTMAGFFTLFSMMRGIPPVEGFLGYVLGMAIARQGFARLSNWWTRNKPGAPDLEQWKLLWMMSMSPLVLEAVFPDLVGLVFLLHFAVQGYFTIAMPHRDFLLAASTSGASFPPVDREAPTAPPPED